MATHRRFLESEFVVEDDFDSVKFQEHFDFIYLLYVVNNSSTALVHYYHNGNLHVVSNNSR